MNFIKMNSLFAGVALLAGIGVANATEPMRLTDVSMDEVTAGTYGGVFFTKHINTNVYANLDVNKTVWATTNVHGQLADAEAAASCFSYNCLTETLTVTNTGYLTPTTSYSQSLSATNY
jgi:hypothetical protein